VAHLYENKKIRNRISRIKGQLQGVERAIEARQPCFEILQTVAACRGAMNGLMRELIEEHISEHIMTEPKVPQSEQDRAAQELIELLNTYWK